VEHLIGVDGVASTAGNSPSPTQRGRSVGAAATELAQAGGSRRPV